jgi:glycosyltransferase involved in cell wall biosynthesis
MLVFTLAALKLFKNAAELVTAIPLILEQTNTEQFIVIGPGEFAPIIKNMVLKYPTRLNYIESIPRKEAMQHLRSAGYGFTPVADCGLGFIGDCWGTGTPLITTHELDGFINKDIDALVADNVYDLPKTINSLLESDDLFGRMQCGGKERYLSNFTAQAVGEKYLQVIQDVLKRQQKIYRRKKDEY